MEPFSIRNNHAMFAGGKEQSVDGSNVVTDYGLYSLQEKR
jgi:hypothetical protein